MRISAGRGGDRENGRLDASWGKVREGVRGQAYYPSGAGLLPFESLDASYYPSGAGGRMHMSVVFCILASFVFSLRLVGPLCLASFRAGSR